MYIKYNIHVIDILPKKKKHEYSIDHYQNQFYLLSNQNKKENFQLYSSTNLNQWKIILKHSIHKYIESFDLWYDSILISCRENGFPKLLIMNLKTFKIKTISFSMKYI